MNLQKENQQLIYDNLKAKLKDKEGWKQAFEDQTDLNFQKFLGSGLFASNDTVKEKVIDENKLELFAIFSCKDVDQTASIATLIREIQPISD